ncbi:hypothetical protein WMY93_030969 [Mugilogobius chulae]|uniref:Uncharacterized protein n=1 Tax=Mugilogobius chulae TaxID=88201 RepID=A0AAW0MG61_9GOBI
MVIIKKFPERPSVVSSNQFWLYSLSQNTFYTHKVKPALQQQNCHVFEEETHKANLSQCLQLLNVHKLVVVLRRLEQTKGDRAAEAGSCEPKVRLKKLEIRLQRVQTEK